MIKENSNQTFLKIPCGTYLAYKYKYNGKEWQDELGLNFYDYGARNYDPALGRFMNMDKFSEKYYHLNPYQYGANNPIIYNDIKGDSILIYSKQDKAHIKYDNGNLYSRNSKTGKWETYNGKNVKVDKNGNKTIGGFLGKATAALDKIRTGGSDGAQLVGDLQDASKPIMIKQGDNGYGGSVKWDPNDESGGPNQSGNNKRHSYIGLAHELGHAHDDLDGNLNDTPIGRIGDKIIQFNEIYAMGWENKVRAENNLPLRTHYGNDASGNIIGQMYQRGSMPSVQFQVNFSNTGVIQIVPVNTKSTMVIIPIKNY